MVDPLAMTIATNVATKVADTLTDQAQQAIAAIIKRVREKLRSRPSEYGEVATLDGAIAIGDTPTTEALARMLEQLFAADSQFQAEIYALWVSAHSANSVTNIFHGKTDKVIMMRDVNGDLTINLVISGHDTATAAQHADKTRPRSRSTVGVNGYGRARHVPAVELAKRCRGWMHAAGGVK